MKQFLLLFNLLLLFSFSAQAQLTATVSSTNPGCASATGSVTVNASGGSSYTYKWSTGATSATINNLAAGTYTVTVYSAGGTQWDTVFFETFDGSPAWTLNTSTGTNGADPNFWTISDNEGGVAPGGCGVGTNGNKTLHITSVFNPTGGAAYDAGGLCGILYCPQTAMAATSPAINTNGASNLVLRYDFIAGGSGLADNASSLYSINGGTGYTSLDASLKSSTCGGGQGSWTYRTYALPASCNNLSNLLLRFNWVNNDDGVGTDPSVAINNVLLRDSIALPGDSVVKTVTLTAPAPPTITNNNLVINQPGCGQNNGSVTGLSVSGGSSPYTVQWLNAGSVVGNTYPLTNVGPGTYVFEVTDSQGCTDTAQFLLSGTSLAPISLSPTNDTICPRDTGEFCIPGSWSSYLWSTGSTQACIRVTVEGTYTVTATDANGCSAASVPGGTLVVRIPSAVSITYSNDTLKAFNAVSYQWFVDGVLIPNATAPVYVPTESGSYTVQAVDAHGCYTNSQPVIVVISGVKDLQKEEILVYPNPNTTGKWQLLVSAPLVGATYTVVDIEGRVIYSGVVNALQGTMSIAHLADGFYYLYLNGTVRKLLKQ